MIDDIDINFLLGIGFFTGSGSSSTITSFIDVVTGFIIELPSGLALDTNV